MNDFFKKHKITHHLIAEGADDRGKPTNMEMIHFRHPDHYKLYALEFTLVQGRHLVVTGDYGYAIYSWSDPHPFEWFANTDFGYFASKCRASHKGEHFSQWSYEHAVAVLDSMDKDTQWWNDFSKSGKDSLKSFMEWNCWLNAPCCEKCEEGIRNIDNYFSGLSLENIWNIGYVPHEWCRIHHDALKALFNLV